MIRVNWNITEAVVLVDLYFSNGESLSVPSERLHQLTAMLKKKADASGIVYDENFRNLSGLRQQLGCIRHVVDNEQSGNSHAGKIFYQAYDLYCNNPVLFCKIRDDFYRAYADYSKNQR